jgi:hypothetical protein
MMPQWFLAAMARAESLSLDSAHDRARLWFLLSDELRRHGLARLLDADDAAGIRPWPPEPHS